MSRFNKLLANFKMGEVSPKFYGRKDLEEYSGGGQLFDNMVPQVEGGFATRSGSKFMADVSTLADGDKGPALIPFVSTKKDAYVIAVRTDGTNREDAFRLYKNDGTYIPWDYVAYPVTAQPPALDPKGFVYAQIGDMLAVTHTSGLFKPLFITKQPGDDNFSIVIYENFIPNSQLTQTDGAVLKNPFRPVNVSPITLTPSVLIGGGTLTASADYFTPENVGSLFKLTHGAITGICGVISYVSPTVVNISVVSANFAFGATTATDNWQENAWSTRRGWPRTVSVFEQRFVWGGNESQPDTLWFSRLGNVFHMMERRLAQDANSDVSGLNYFIPAIPDDQKEYSQVSGIQILPSDPFQVPLPSNEVNNISWISAGSTLMVGTVGGEFIIGSQGQGLSINTVTIRKQTSFGGSPRKVVRTKDEALFITRGGDKLRTFKFNNENGSFVSADISLTAEHLRRVGGAVNAEFDNILEWKELAHQSSKDTLLLINSTNQLIGLVYSKENGNISWYRYTFPNSNFAPVSGDSSEIWGVTSIPNEDGGFDDIWMVVERTNINGRQFYLEKLGAKFEGDSLIATPYVEEFVPRFLDSFIAVNNLAGAALTTISGLDHLEGMEVKFMYRGEDLGTYTVDGSGEITLNAEAQIKVQVAGLGVVGIYYESSWRSLDVEAGGDLGFSEGHVQRVERAFIRFYKTRSARVGSISQQDPVKFNHSNVTALFSGMKEIRIPNSPDTEQIIEIKNTESQPMHVLSVTLRGSTDD